MPSVWSRSKGGDKFRGSDGLRFFLSLAKLLEIRGAKCVKTSLFCCRSSLGAARNRGSPLLCHSGVNPLISRYLIAEMQPSEIKFSSHLDAFSRGERHLKKGVRKAHFLGESLQKVGGWSLPLPRHLAVRRTPWGNGRPSLQANRTDSVFLWLKKS